MIRNDVTIDVTVEEPGEPPRSWSFGLSDRFAPEIARILLGEEDTRPVKSLTANLASGGTLTWTLVG